MERPTVLLADDHKIVLEGLRGLLESDFNIVGTAEDGRATVEAVKQLDPDVVVADISMPGLNGLEAAEHLRKEGVRTKVIFLTMLPDIVYAVRALQAGAVGYVLKHAAPSELVTAIRLGLKGEIYITPSIDKQLIESFMDRSRNKP